MTEITPDMMKQVPKKDFIERMKAIKAEEDARKAKALTAFVAVVLAIVGYIILIVIDWRIAVAVWLINWAINIERNKFKNGQ